jgi:hypothetical protein
VDIHRIRHPSCGLSSRRRLQEVPQGSIGAPPLLGASVVFLISFWPVAIFASPLATGLSACSRDTRSICWSITQFTSACRRRPPTSIVRASITRRTTIGTTKAILASLHHSGIACLECESRIISAAAKTLIWAAIGAGTGSL